MEKITFEDFEYAAFIARKYCRPQEFDNDEQIQQMAAEYAYNAFIHMKIDDFNENYDIYTTNEKIQDTLRAYELDPFKFWVLFVFIKQLTFDCFSEKMEFLPTAEEIARNIIRIIGEHPTLAKLSIGNDTETYQFRNYFVTQAIKTAMEDILENTGGIGQSAFVKKIEKEYPVQRIMFMTKLFREFLKAKVLTRKPSKMSFIGAFLYLSKLVDKRYLNGYSANTLATSENQDDAESYGTICRNGIKYVKEPFDVGRHLSGLTKKSNAREPQLWQSKLFYNPDDLENVL